MLGVTEIAEGILRVSFWDEEDLVHGGIIWPGVTYNMFVIKGSKTAIINTMYRKSFARIQRRIAERVDLKALGYIVVPHHEGDSSGAVNEWSLEGPRAEVLCSELCAALSLRDLCDRPPRAVKDEEVVDLGSHRLRFLMTPQVNQWDSLMVYEEATRTLFPNDLFSHMGIAATTREDPTSAALGAARELGYQPNDRQSLLRALDKIASLKVDVVANMHGPTVYGHCGKLVEAFRNNELS